MRDLEASYLDEQVANWNMYEVVRRDQDYLREVIQGQDRELEVARDQIMTLQAENEGLQKAQVHLVQTQLSN